MESARRVDAAKISAGPDASFLVLAEGVYCIIRDGIGVGVFFMEVGAIPGVEIVDIERGCGLIVETKRRPQDEALAEALKPREVDRVRTRLERVRVIAVAHVE